MDVEALLCELIMLDNTDDGWHELGSDLYCSQIAARCQPVNTPSTRSMFMLSALDADMNATTMQCSGGLPTCTARRSYRVGSLFFCGGNVRAPVPSSRLRCVKCRANTGVAFV